MIVVEEPAGLLVIGQPDHAFAAGRILSLWRSDGLPEHPRRDDLVFATRHHDNGWRETDAAPPVDPGTGLPFDFTTLPLPLRQAVWRRGVERYATERPTVALLVAWHALHLHHDRRGDPEWEGFLADLEERRDELLEATGLDRDEVAADYRFLHLADLLSLAACARWGGPFERFGFSARRAGDTIHLAPFPLAGATTFEVPARRLPLRRYRGDADLGAELAAARWQEVSFRLAPEADSGA